MKNAILLTLITLTLFMPPVSIYLAFSAAATTELEEITSRQYSRAIAELNEFDHLTNKPELLMREINRLKGNAEGNNKNLHENIVDGSLERYLNEHVPPLIESFDFPIQVDCFMKSAIHKHIYKLISYGDNLGLTPVSMRVAQTDRNRLQFSTDGFEQPGRYIDATRLSTARSREISANTLKMQELLYRCFSELSLSSIEKMALRDHDSSFMLTAENAQSQLMIYVLAETSDQTTHNAVFKKIAAADSADLGLGAVLDGHKTPILSEYFNKQPELRQRLIRLLKTIDNNPLQTEISGHKVIINAYDERLRGRSFIVMPLPVLSSREKLPQGLLLAIMFMVSCLAFKVLVEKIILDRGPDLPIRLLLPATFLFLVIQPVFVATYLSVDFFRNSYANEKSRASTKLSSDLQNIDLATIDGFRDNLNLARSFSSIERIASYTGVSYQQNEPEFCFALLEQIFRENSSAIYSSLSLSVINRPFAGVRWNERSKKHEVIELINPVFTYFHKRFQEILLEKSGKAGADDYEAPKSLDREIKNEFSRDFFLKILGSESFYRFRQNSSVLLSFNTKFKRELVLTLPVSYQNRPFAYAAWHVGDSGGFANRSFPNESLSLSGKSPRIAFRGSARVFFGHHFDREQIFAAQPELFRICQLAHFAKTRITSRLDDQEKTVISEAFPTSNAKFTIAGSEILQSYQLFSRDLAKRNLTNLAVLIILGLTLAFVGALYFVTPLRELTLAAYRIAKGDYSCRISENHPDEFARTGEAFNRMATGLDEGQRLKGFVSDSVRREIASADETEIASRARSRQATIIFSAICGFADFQKTHQAGEVFALLQKHLQAADLAIKSFGGEIDKMIEDKIMIVFEHDEPGPEMSERAIKLAETVSAVMLNDTGKPLGIGINTGLTVAGIMGAVNARLARTVVGDPVNLAARLASLAVQRPEGGIIASQQILAGLPDDFKADKLPINKVKGKTQTVEAYLLQNLNSGSCKKW